MKLPWGAVLLLFVSSPVGSAPSTRLVVPEWKSFHSSAVANGKVIIFGGINNTTSGTNPTQIPGTTDLYVWDLKTHSWTQPIQDSAPKTPQKFHVSVSPITSNKIFTFLPYFDQSEGPVAVLDTNSWSWSYISSTGAVPIPRLAFTFTISNEEAYLFGGIQTTDTGALNVADILSDLNDFDTSQQIWYSASSGPAIYFHTACYLASQNSILYFGGSVQGQAVNRLHLYNLSTKSWQLDVPYLGGNGGSTVPSARIGHTANCLTDKMIVFGGTGGTGANTVVPPTDNDVWILEFVNNTFTWSRAPIRNKLKSPIARMGHTATLDNDQLYIYGGVGAEGDNSIYRLDLLNWNWSRFDVNPDVTQPIPTDISFQPDNVADNNEAPDSNGKVIVIVAVMSSLFGILAMAVIIGVGIRSWKRKKQRNRIADENEKNEGKPCFTFESDTVSYHPSSSFDQPKNRNITDYECSSLSESGPHGKGDSLRSYYNYSPSEASSHLLLGPSGAATSLIGLSRNYCSDSPDNYICGLQRHSSAPNSRINDRSIRETLSPLDRIARLTLEKQYLNGVAQDKYKRSGRTNKETSDFSNQRNDQDLHIVNSLNSAVLEDKPNLSLQLTRISPKGKSPITSSDTQEFNKDYNLDVFATVHDHSPRVKESLDELREVLLAETSIRVPRLFVIMPGEGIGDSWKIPSQWNQGTFVLYILCEHYNTHITSHPGFPIAHPHEFLKNAGYLISAISRYCSIHSLPFHTPATFQQLPRSDGDDPIGEYFAEIVNVLEKFTGERSPNDNDVGWERGNEESQIRWLEQAKKTLPHTLDMGLTQLKDYLPKYVIARPLAGLHHTKIDADSFDDVQECTRWLCGYHHRRYSTSHTL